MRWLDGFLAHHSWWRKVIGGSWYRVRIYGDMRNAFPRGEEWFRWPPKTLSHVAVSTEDREDWYTA